MAGGFPRAKGPQMGFRGPKNGFFGVLEGPGEGPGNVKKGPKIDIFVKFSVLGPFQSDSGLWKWQNWQKKGQKLTFLVTFRTSRIGQKNDLFLIAFGPPNGSKNDHFLITFRTSKPLPISYGWTWILDLLKPSIFQ